MSNAQAAEPLPRPSVRAEGECFVSAVGRVHAHAEVVEMRERFPPVPAK